MERTHPGAPFARRHTDERQRRITPVVLQGRLRPGRGDPLFRDRQLVNFPDYSIDSARRREDGGRQRVYTGVQWSSRGRQVAGLDDPAGHMADLVESGAVDMELAADADRDEMREFLDRVDVDAAVAKAKHN